MLSDAEIKEIEERRGKFGSLWTDIDKLLATVKEQRELIRDQSEYTRHSEGCNGVWKEYKCKCGYDELQKQIEEKVK